MENTNKFEFVGSIVSISYRDGSVAVKLAIDKPGTVMAGTQRIRDFPRIFWYGEAAERVNEKFKVRDRVRVTGMIDTSRITRSNDRLTHQQMFLGDEIDYAKSDCETVYGLMSSLGISHYVDENEIRIHGKVVRIFAAKDKDFARAIIQTTGNNRVNFPEVTFYRRTAQFVKENIKVGDKVYIIALAQTHRVRDENDSKWIYHEDIVCSEIAIKPESDEEEEAI